jgi:hypothetical protein
MPPISKPFITHAKDSPAYWQIGNLWRVMATGVQTDNSFTLLDQVVHSGGGGGPVTHTHMHKMKACTSSVGNAPSTLAATRACQAPPGTFVAIPGDCEHSFTVDDANTQILNFYLPAGFEQLLIGVSHPAEERGPPSTRPHRPNAAS